jgi:hypothetical protein
MLCKIWGFHSSDYEECRLLIYKNPVRTSQETHYVSTTESSQLMLCKIWVFTAVTMKNDVIWDIKTQFVLHRRHYVSATESSRLMLCKIWGFHGGDYEECRLLGYKNPVLTSQVTHYISDTELSQLVLCKIWGFHGSDYEACQLLGYRTPVHTTQETHYVSNKVPSRLMYCKILGVHYEECHLLGC